MPTRGTAVIRVRQATLVYKRLVGVPKVAVTDVTLEMKPGEIHALLGPNRAGKTTLVRALLGLLAPVQGTVRVHNLDPVANRRQVAALTGALLDGGRVLPPRWTGLEVLVFAGVLHGLPIHEARRRGRHLLEQFGLGDVAHELINKYSRGMRQRLLLGTTLVHEPSLLILDEPTLGLDADSARDLRQCLLAKRAEGRSILLTTHEMALVEALADRVTVLNGGRTVATGSVPDVAAALGARQRVHISVSEVPEGMAGLPGVAVEGHTIHAPIDFALLSRLFATLAESRVSVYNVSSDAGLDAVVGQTGGKAR